MHCPNLAFSKNRELKILQMTDIHYDNGCPADKKTTRLMQQLIAWEKPDLIMVTGDITTGIENVRMVSTALKPVFESNVPWAFVFGNHDAEYGQDHDALLKELLMLPGCMNEPPVEGVFGKSNYAIPLVNGDGKTEWLLIGIDSNMYNKNPGMDGYDYIRLSQVAWYEHTLRSAENTVPGFGSLAFFHIALPEYNEVWETQVCYGEKNEDVCCSKQNSGLFSVMLEGGHTRGTFAGHDHVNDYWGELHGIKLCFGRATGYNTYGKRGFLRGGRVIVLKEENTNDFATWLRLSDGTVVTEQKPHQPQRTKQK